MQKTYSDRSGSESVRSEDWNPCETGVRNWDLENQALSAKMTCTNCKYQFCVVVMLF